MDDIIDAQADRIHADDGDLAKAEEEHRQGLAVLSRCLPQQQPVGRVMKVP